MPGSLHCVPDGLQSREPAVRRRFVPDPAPDPLLGIQGRLVAREVLKPQPGMGAQEGIDVGSPMPARPIDVAPDRVPPEPPGELAKDVKEPSPIPPGRPHHPGAAQERGHPPGEIEAGPVLARRRHPYPLALLSPDAPRAGAA